METQIEVLKALLADEKEEKQIFITCEDKLLGMLETEQKNEIAYAPESKTKKLAKPFQVRQATRIKTLLFFIC